MNKNLIVINENNISTDLASDVTFYIGIRNWVRPTSIAMDLEQRSDNKWTFFIGSDAPGDLVQLRSSRTLWREDRHDEGKEHLENYDTHEKGNSATWKGDTYLIVGVRGLL